MAITSISASGGSVGKHIRYACDPAKTQEEIMTVLPSGEKRIRKKTWVTCLNCRSGTAAEQFSETRRFWDRAIGGRSRARVTCYHGFISFDKGEVNAEKAHTIGVALIKRLWGDGYEAVIATHLNTGYIHDHFVVNSVSWRDGDMKLGNRIWYPLFRTEADRICLENGLKVQEESYGRKRHPAEYAAEKEGKPTLRSLIRWDIDRAVRSSVTMREFMEIMEKMGYELDLDTERKKGGPALLPPGSIGFYSLRRLGREYTAESISGRILQRSGRDVRPMTEILEDAEALRKQLYTEAQEDGIYGLLKRYRAELEVLIRFPETVRTVPFPLREDIIRTARTDRQLQFMDRTGLKEKEELQGFISEKEKELEGLTAERRQLRNQQNRYRKRDDREGAEKEGDKIRELSSRMKEVRKERDIAQEILGSEDRIDENLVFLQKENEEMRRKEEMSDEQLLGRRGGPGREDRPGRD